jgi:hypothetical protein
MNFRLQTVFHGTVLFWQLVVIQLVKKFPGMELHHDTHKSSSMDPIHSQSKSNQIVGLILIISSIYNFISHEIRI